MFNAPTPWQWFLDLVSQKRFADVISQNNPEQLEQAKKYYQDLLESEVVFTQPVFVEKKLNPEKSYWKVSYDCIGRGYSRPDITFRTYQLTDMVSKNAKPVAGNVEDITVPGFYIDLANGQLHLVYSAEEQASMFDMLQATGYRFDAEHCIQETYPEYNQDVKAHGHVSVTYPHVAGKIYLTMFSPIVEAPVEKEQEEEQVTTETDVEEETVSEQEQSSEVKVETNTKYQQNNKKNRR